jgi:hypothetical protein
MFKPLFNIAIKITIWKWRLKRQQKVTIFTFGQTIFCSTSSKRQYSIELYLISAPTNFIETTDLYLLPDACRGLTILRNEV